VLDTGIVSPAVTVAPMTYAFAVVGKIISLSAIFPSLKNI